MASSHWMLNTSPGGTILMATIVEFVTAWAQRASVKSNGYPYVRLPERVNEREPCAFANAAGTPRIVPSPDVVVHW